MASKLWYRSPHRKPKIEKAKLGDDPPDKLTFNRVRAIARQRAAAALKRRK